jgi:hypothetical protein
MAAFEKFRADINKARGIQAISQFLKVLCIRKGASESSRPIRVTVGCFSFSALREKQTLLPPMALNTYRNNQTHPLGSPQGKPL